MSYYLIDIDTKLDFSKIIIGNTININEELQKVYIYYLDDTPKELFIKIPPVRLIYNYKNLKYNQIKLPIYPNWDKTIKFIKLIKKLEKFIRLNINCENAIFVNSIDKTNNISSIKLNISPQLKIKSGINNILLDNLKVNSEIECIINISHVWLKKNSYGLSLSCYQIKYYPRVDEENIDFFDKPSKDTSTKDYISCNNISCNKDYISCNNISCNKDYTISNKDYISCNKDYTISNKDYMSGNNISCNKDYISCNKDYISSNKDYISSNKNSYTCIKPVMFISSTILNEAIIKLNKIK